LKNAGDARVLRGNIGLTRGHRTEHKRQRRSETGGGARPAWAPATLRVYPNSSDQESSIGVACGEHITEMATILQALAVRQEGRTILQGSPGRRRWRIRGDHAGPRPARTDGKVVQRLAAQGAAPLTRRPAAD